MKRQIPSYTQGEIRIEKGIPIPSPKQDVNWKYPVPNMKRGDSFFVQTDRPIANLNAQSSGWKKKTGFRFVMRTVYAEGHIQVGIRVWRVK